MNNLPMPVIAALLGHANGDLRMVTKQYAHLSDSYVSDTLESICLHSLSNSRLLPLCFSSEHCNANLIYLTAPSQLKTVYPLANTW
jgi:hypothetical protein